MTLLIDRNVVDGISAPFVITNQITVFALGLADDEYVEFDILMLSDPLNGGCDCPPLVVSALNIQALAPLGNCNGPIQLSAERPFVVLDAPQNVRLRARLMTDEPITVQRVWFEQTNTPNLTNYMRGYDCT